MNYQPTTDLDLVKKGHPFTWGVVLNIHTLGRYTFVEYSSRLLDGVQDGLEDVSTFHLYVDGASTGCGFTSLEGAMLYAVAIIKLPAHERGMAIAAAKLLGVGV